MKPPRRKHYTIEPAAKRLGVDIDEVKYHLSQGRIQPRAINEIKGSESVTL
jgi:hypothetical protein